jgi:hypothetical protein
MPSGSSLRRKVATTLARVQASAYPVYLRQVTFTGGDSLLGVGQTTTVTDTLVDPMPAVDLLPTSLVVTSGGLYQAGDYRITFAATVIEEATLRNSLIRYGDHILRIVRIDPVAFGGMVVAWEVIARTAQPGS